MAAEFLFPRKLHLAFFCFCSCATTVVVATGPLITTGLLQTGASPIFRVVLVCNRSKISLSPYTIGCGRCDARFELLISRLSEELDVVLLPEETTGEASIREVSPMLSVVLKVRFN
jgi:transcription elongation factor Elf1